MTAPTIPWPFLASTHLAKIISECKHPAPCMVQAACDALAQHLAQAFDRIDPERTGVFRMHDGALCVVHPLYPPRMVELDGTMHEVIPSAPANIFD